MKTKLREGLLLLAMTLIFASALLPFPSVLSIVIASTAASLALIVLYLYMSDSQKNKTEITKVGDKKAKLTPEEVAEIKRGMQAIELKMSESANKKWQASVEEAKRLNSVCPKCGGQRVGDRIKRQQGKIDGSIHGMTSLFGAGSIHGSIHGEMDTNEVNKCKDCEHEWKKHVPTSWGNVECLKFKIESITWSMYNFKQAKNCTYDALDTTEKYFSLEGKRSDLLKKTFTSFRFEDCKELWKGVKIDVINELAKKHLEEYGYERWLKDYDEDALLAFGLIY